MADTPDDRILVELLDESSGETLIAEVCAEIEYEGALYALLIPAEPLVTLLRFDPSDDESELEEMEPSDFGPIEETINKQLGKHDCRIEVRADEFILTGDPPESFYDDPETIEVETENGDKELLILQEIKVSKKLGYMVAVAADPPMYPAELLDGGKARLLSPEALAGDLGEAFNEARDMFFGEDDEEAV
ncbi:MAG: hypothetical protein KC620_24510 [Myxococcales bacterium]|nr:hypothetical protein [Myxococcales bacterium]